MMKIVVTKFCEGKIYVHSDYLLNNIVAKTDKLKKHNYLTFMQHNEQ